MRHLKGYSIQSRQFANVFRESFKRFDKKWENVSVKFGPVTLMEGWLKVEYSNSQDEIVALANNRIEIEQLIDDTLTHFK